MVSSILHQIQNNFSNWNICIQCFLKSKYIKSRTFNDKNQWVIKKGMVLKKLLPHLATRDTYSPGDWRCDEAWREQNIGVPSSDVQSDVDLLHMRIERHDDIQLKHAWPMLWMYVYLFIIKALLTYLLLLFEFRNTCSHSYRADIPNMSTFQYLAVLNWKYPGRTIPNQPHSCWIYILAFVMMLHWYSKSLQIILMIDGLFILWNCPHMNDRGPCCWLAPTGSGNGLVPSSQWLLRSTLPDGLTRPQRVKASCVSKGVRCL